MPDWQEGGGSETVQQAFDKLSSRFMGSRPPTALIPLIIGGLLLIWAGSSSFYQVGTEETGVVVRFGRFTTFAEPGLHFKIPFGIERVHIAKTGRVMKEEFGFRTVQAGERTTYSTESLDEESLTLTGDLNVSDLEWIVQYQIADPYKYLFHIEDPRSTIRDIAEAATRSVVGNSNVTDVLTTERALLATAIQQEVQTTLDGYDIGVRIVTVKFQDVNPPESVKAAFNEVNEAEQEKESLIFQASEQYNREVPKASGVAKSTILEAEGYALERINQARGDTARFLALYTEYKKSPKVTRERLYMETLEEILPRMDEIYVMDNKGTSAVPFLPLRSVDGGAK